MLYKLLTTCSLVFVSLPATPIAGALMWPSYTVQNGNATTGRMRNHSTRRKRSNIVEHSGVELRNTERKNEVKLIINLINQYLRLHPDDDIKQIPLDKPKEMCATNAKTCVGLVDLRYMIKDRDFPVDPQQPASSNSTGYAIYKDWKGKLFVSAPHAEEKWIIKEPY